MNTIIETALSDYNGKKVKPLEKIVRLTPSASDINSLIQILIAQPEHEEPASWILKGWAENGHSFSDKQIANWLTATQSSHHWGAILHFLQTTPHFHIDETTKNQLFAFAVEQIRSDNKLIRTWAYNTISVIGQQFPELRSRALDLIEQGQDDPAASVRARLRNIRKRL